MTNKKIYISDFQVDEEDGDEQYPWFIFLSKLNNFYNFRL
jgi:hypothetical protein